MEPDGLPCSLGPCPLEEPVRKNHTSPRLERIPEGWPPVQALGAGVDLLVAALRILRPVVDQPPPSSAQFPILVLQPHDPVRVGGRNIVPGPVFGLRAGRVAIGAATAGRRRTEESWVMDLEW